ncbi:BKACE family enzyme [Dongia deserti]|uniref:3-keto-5-aminohexanoate cleavage protein n=1 Tax=Dongia deserti TaxID=2268030 RepID=UPI000E6509C7|nr:3-keto-5-aminohexanoate cleavage protein [Dongia deserti]
MATHDPIDPNGTLPVAIAVAPNGGRRTKADHPALPLTQEEIAATASACLDAGACMIHVHVRDRSGGHLLNADAYRTAIAAIRAAVGERMVVQITSEALGIYRSDEQMAVVRDVRPEAVSLALRELVPDASHESSFAGFLAWLRTERVIPQIILYSPEEAVKLAALKARGLVPFEDVPVLYVLGRYTARQRSTPADLLPFLAAEIPRFAHWSVCAFGVRENACVTAGALLGGHVRVGFENNLLLPDGSIAPDNAALVAGAQAAIGTCGLLAATANELRAAWNRTA